MVIRLLQEKDLDILIPFMQKTWQQTYPNFCAEEPAIVNSVIDSTEVKKEINHNPQNVFFGAFLDEQLVGYAHLKISREKSFLDKIYVDNTLQRQGIGKQLLISCFNHAISFNVFNMGLEVEDINTKAISFYKKNGFVCHPIKRLYPSTGAKLYYNYIMVCSNLKNAIALLEEENTSQSTSRFSSSMQ